MLRHAHAVAEGPVPHMKAPDTGLQRQVLIDALVGLDLEYERERKRLSQSSLNPETKVQMLAGLKDQHCKKRRPYLDQLAALQEPAPSVVSLEAPDPNTCMLSLQEAEILRLLMQGRGSNVIASELKQDEMMIRDQIRTILRKVRAKGSNLRLVRTED